MGSDWEEINAEQAEQTEKMLVVGRIIVLQTFRLLCLLCVYFIYIKFWWRHGAWFFTLKR